VHIVKGIDRKYKRHFFRRLYNHNVLQSITLKLTKTYRTKSIACLNAVFINSKDQNTVKYNREAAELCMFIIHVFIFVEHVLALIFIFIAQVCGARGSAVG